MRTIVLFLLGSLLLQGTQAQLADRLLRRDQDGDGKLSQEEAPTRLKQNFAKIDANADGFVDRAELEALSKQMADKQRERPPQRRQSASLPDGVTLTKDVPYREGNPKWVVDLYRPEGEAPEEGRPGLVVIHGGGWRGGDKAGGLWSSVPAMFAEKGYVAISVNYRLYPEVGILDCIADVKTAVRWFRAQAEDFGVDPERIGAFGNSAGAHLVSLLGLTTKEVGLEGDGPYQEYPSHVQAVCAGATPSSFVRKEGDERPPHPAFTKGSGTIEERARRASPVTYVNDHSPPFLLIHAKDDRTVPFSQGQLLHDRLQESGRDVTFLVYETGGHGIVSGKQEETLPAMEAFFDEALKHKTLQGPLP